jgi:hypothetical protein
MLKSPGKVRRLFHKKRQAFDKSNKLQPTDMVTRLDKLHEDFGVLQTIANKAKGGARVAEQNKFETTRERMLTNLDRVQKHLKKDKEKASVKPFYRAVWQTTIIVEQFDLQGIDAAEQDTPEDGQKFDAIDIAARENGQQTPILPPTATPTTTPPTTPRNVGPPPNRLPPQPPTPLRQSGPQQTVPQETAPEQSPRERVAMPPLPQPDSATRRQAKGPVITSHRQLAGQAMTALGTLENTKDFSKNAVKTLDELAKKGIFSQDKNLAKLADTMRDYVKLKTKPGTDPAAVKQAWKSVGNMAKAYTLWAEQQYPAEIASGAGNKFERCKFARAILAKCKSVDDSEATLSATLTQISRDVILALNESDRYLKTGAAQGHTASGTSVRLLEDLAKHPSLPPKLKSAVEALLPKAKLILAAEGQRRLAELTDTSVESQASLLLELGGCKPPPPGVKGTSDSFILYGFDGKPAYFYKPHDGEQRAGADWPEKCGATREVLLSKLNDQLAGDLGLDCRVPKTELAELTDETFRAGTISQNPRRVGALVKAVSFQPGDPKNATDWFAAEKIDANGHHSETDVEGQMARLNPKDCQAALILNFLTLDVDSNPGNILITNVGGGPGQARVTPIDAGRKLPNPEAYKRAALGMSLNTPPAPGKFSSDDPFLLQTPAAVQPFDADMIARIRQMDPERIADGMRAEYAEAVRKAPDLADTVEEGSFDLVKKSAQFLKQAVEAQPPLTPYDLAEIYAKGFTGIADAGSPEETDQAIQEALQAMQTIKASGGEAAVQQRVPDLSTISPPVTIQQKARVLAGEPPINNKADFEQYHYQELQRELHDIATYIADGPEEITDELNRPYSKEYYNYLKLLAEYKLLGGDAMLKKLIDCDETYRVEVAKPLANRSGWPYRRAKQYYGKGGTPALIKLVGADDFDRDFRGKEIEDLHSGLQAALAKAQG